MERSHPPTPEHERLRSHVGTWTVDCTYFMPPPQEPLRVQATERVEALGPYFTVSRFEADLFGTPFQGRATLGYDPRLQRHVSTWIDTMTPHLFHFEGTCDASGRVLTMHAEGPSMAGEGTARYTTREEEHDDGTRTLEMFVDGPDGTPLRIFRYRYRRAH